MTLSQGSEAGGSYSTEKTGSSVPCSTEVVGGALLQIQLSQAEFKPVP